MHKSADAPPTSRDADKTTDDRVFRVRRLAFASFILVFAATALVLAFRAQRADRVAIPTVFRLQSRSMEPSWFGPRFELTCPECGERVVMTIDVASSKSLTRSTEASPEIQAFREQVRVMTCRNCGYDRAPADSAVFREGDLVCLTPVGSSSRLLERWRVAIFRDSSGVCSLKRIVGLPGERVAIRNGDVWIDGKLARRSLEEIRSVATEMRPTVVTRGADRVYATYVVVSRAAKDGTERVETTPSAISNESPTPSFNGGASSSVELARDFETRFRWDADGAEGERLVALVRRPDRAWFVEYSPTKRTVSARSTALRDGRASSGRPFELLTPDDFADAKESTAPTPRVAWRGTLDVSLSAVDGELIVAVGERELARLDLGDAASTATAAISTPFAILGDASRASSMRIFRDVHYSSLGEREWTTPPGRYFVLGDNSPASRDSRFPDVGEFSVENVIGVATTCNEDRRE